MTLHILEMQGQKLVFGVPVPIGSGEANEAANVGAGAGVFRDKVAATINLRTISGTGGIVTSVNGDVVEVDGSNAGPGGDVVGPAGATDEAIARYDTATGKLIQDSLAKVDDAGNITTPGNVDGRDVSADGATLDSHVADTSNPHSTTAVQVGADPVGSAATVQSNLDTHIADATNPHSVTAAQAGADPAGTAAAERAAHEAAFDHANLPTASEKAALAGTSGTPSGANRYVTDADARNSDARTPTGAAGGDLSGTYPNPTVPHVILTNNPHSVTAGQVGAIPAAEKGAPNGVATLDVSGDIPISQIPDSARPIVHEVADAAARIALGLGADEEGHEAIQADDSSQWLWTGTAWVSRLAAAGDVVGPASAGNNELAVYDGTTGKLIKRPDATISANGHSIDNVNLVDGRDVSIDGAKLDGIAAGAQPNQDIVAGAGLTGGGSGATVNLAADFGTGAGEVVEGNDTRVPTQPENDALQGTSGTPSGTNRYVTDADDRVPTQNENDALQGTDGSPSGLNRYVTDSDPRMTDDRYPTAHNPTHENGGADEINVAGLSGQLADAQTPVIHAIAGARHSASTLAALNSKISDANVDDAGDPRDPNAHQTTHIKGGSDVIDVEELGSGSEPTDRFLASDGAGGNKWVPAATPGTIEPDDAALEGTADTYSRGDHQHAIVCDTPGSVTPGDVPAEGSATSFARSDHVHGVSAFGTPGSIQPDDSAAEGSANTFARSDHIHQIGAAAPSAIAVSNVNTEGTSTDFARADHIHATVGAGTLADLTKEPTGFPNLSDSVISFTPSPNRRFAIAPAVSSFDFYIDGVRFTKSATDTVDLADTTGLWFIYYDATGTLQASLTPWAFGAPVAFVATVYWNSAASTQGILGEERHGLVMDWRTHQYLHETNGTQFVTGFGISGFALDTDTDAAVTFGLGNGQIDDEDLRHTIVHSAAPSAPFEQVLQDPAQIPVIYRNGSGGPWIKDAATNFAFKNTVGGTARVNFNAESGGVWSQQEAANNDFVAYWIFATNDPNEPIVSLQGQREDGTLAGARANNGFDSINFGALPSVEWKLLYRIILQTGNGFGGTRLAKIQAVDDFRTAQLQPGEAAAATEHSSLAGLPVGDDHPQYQLRSEIDPVNGYAVLYETSAFDATVRSSGSTAWQQGLRLTTPSVPAGTYRVGWSFNWNHDDKGSQFRAQVEQDDTTQIHLQEEKPVADDGSFGATGTKEKYASSGFRYVTLGAGIHTFDLDFSTETAGKTSSMWNTRLEFWRVS